MSRGLLGVEDKERLPIVVPKANLTKVATNFVTPNGLIDLSVEKVYLQAIN